MKFKDGAKIETGDLFYDLFDGGYIKPEKLLANEQDYKMVNEAIATIQVFIQAAVDQGILEEY